MLLCRLHVRLQHANTSALPVCATLFYLQASISQCEARAHKVGQRMTHLQHSSVSTSRHPTRLLLAASLVSSVTARVVMCSSWLFNSPRCFIQGVEIWIESNNYFAHNLMDTVHSYHCPPFMYVCMLPSCRQAAGHPFCINSTAQLRQVGKHTCTNVHCLCVPEMKEATGDFTGAGCMW